MMWKKGTQLHRIIARVMRPGRVIESQKSKMAGSAESSFA
jgi:hypothetical protein